MKAMQNREREIAGQHQGAAMRDGWETRNLGDLCRIRTGTKDVNEGNPEGKFPFFTCAAEHTFSDNYSFDTEALLIAGNGDVGKVSYYNGKFEAYQRTYVLSDFTEVSPRFLYLILDGKLKDTVSKQKLGNTMPYIKVGMLTGFQLPVPPLAEQQRIVGLLDEAFKGIATAKANAEKNLQNARALFESHLQSLFTQRGPGWVETTLDKISTNLDSKRIPITKNVRTSGEYPYYGASGIVDYVADYIFDGDNLLVSEDGANLLARSTPIAFSVSGKYWVNNHAHILHFENMATRRFVEFYLDNIKLDEYITGAAQPKLNQKALNSIPIPIPKSLDDQAKIVARVESLHEETQRLARLYERKLAALEALKKSLLHQAFSGEL